jgi:sigma-54 dependent transcriptional regulator, acetoin dehydrogenase operon transcriptional activator AcoR
LLQTRSGFYDMWRGFVTKGSTDLVPGNILQSWLRCREAGMDYRIPPNQHCIALNSLSARMEENRAVRSLFSYHFSNMDTFGKDLRCVALLADSEGYVTDISGDDCLLQRFESTGISRGCNLGEKHIGTSAPGLSLIQNSCSAVIAEQHYCEILHQYSCISAPIYNDNSDVLGVIDLSVLAEDSEKLKLLIPLITNLARSIHLELSLKELLEKHSLYDSYFYSNFEYSENKLLLVGVDGKIIDLNRKAQEFLGAYPEKIRNTDFRRVLGCHSGDKSLLRENERICPEKNDADRLIAKSIPIYDRTGNEKAFVLHILPERKHFGIKKDFHKPLYDFSNIIGWSQKDLIFKAQKIARTKSTVLIEGESGTGKELFAQSIHCDVDAPFVAINCSAIPAELIESELFGYERGAFTGAKKEGQPGKFELANGGTIFLDEIQTIGKNVQSKLLRVLEERQVTRIGGTRTIPLDIRVISASSVSLGEQVKKGEFIDALYYRLNVVKLTINPLRVRKGDIPSLIEFFVQSMAKKMKSCIRGVAPDVMQVLCSYDWPGNVRELRNVLESAFNMCEGDTIQLCDLPEMFAEMENEKISLCDEACGSLELPESGIDINGVTTSMQVKLVRQALIRAGGNKSRAAELLNIDRFSLRYLMKKLNIN